MAWVSIGNLGIREPKWMQKGEINSDDHYTQENKYFCFTDYFKVFDSVDRNKLWKIFKEMWTTRKHMKNYQKTHENTCVGQESTVRTRHGKMDWYQIGKRLHQSCIFLSSLFNLYAEFSLVQFCFIVYTKALAMLWGHSKLLINSVQLLSRVWLFATSMDWSTPGFSDNHQYLELAQNHVYQVSDAIQPSHPLSSHTPPAFNISHHWGLFQWASRSKVWLGGQSIVASALAPPINIQDWFTLGLTGLISLKSKGLPRVIFSTTVWFESICPLVLSFLYGSILTSIHDYWKKCIFDTLGLSEK